MTKYLIIKRIIKKPEDQVYEPGLFVDLNLSEECERILIEKRCISRINRKRIKPLAEVIEDGTDNGRN